MNEKKASLKDKFLNLGYVERKALMGYLFFGVPLGVVTLVLGSLFIYFGLKGS